MRTFAVKLLGLGCIIGGAVGCITGCEAPPPAVERVPVAAPGNRTDRIEYDTPKPLPENARLYDRDHEYAPPRPSTDRPPEPR